MYYPCSENKDADQLRGYREADLRLCFRICRLLVFPRGGSYITICFCTFQLSSFLVEEWALDSRGVSVKYMSLYGLIINFFFKKPNFLFKFPLTVAVSCFPVNEINKEMNIYQNMIQRPLLFEK